MNVLRGSEQECFHGKKIKLSFISKEKNFKDKKKRLMTFIGREHKLKSSMREFVDIKPCFGLGSLLDIQHSKFGCQQNIEPRILDRT